MRVAVVLTVLAFGCSSPTEPQLNTEQPLLFFRLDQGDWNMYRMSADGSNVQALSPRPGDDLYPTWFPDHSRIAFISDRDSTGIFLMRPDGSNVMRVYTDPDGGTGNIAPYRLAVSPDGRAIAFTRDSVVAYVHLLSLVDGSDRVLAQGTQTTWSPDGQLIAFGTSGGIAVIRPDGTGLRMLLALPGAGEPAWSRDGRRLVFSRRAGDGNGLLFVADTDGSNQRQLTVPDSGGVEDLGAVWSPDGRWLAFQRLHSAGCRNIGALGCNDVMAVGADGQGLRNLTGGTGTSVRPSW